MPLDFAELWDYRELLVFLTWRDIKVRYKQTFLGAAWAIIQPVMMMLVFTLFFGKLGKIPSDGVPYALFSLAALVPWNLFANGLTQSSDSVVGNAALIKKVYFPRLVVPFSRVAAGLVDFGLSVVVLFLLMAWMGVSPTWNVIWLPLLSLLAVIAALGTGLWLSALNVQFRDVRYVVPFMTQIWMFASPIAYPSTLLPESWRAVYSLNPMVGVVEGFRWALLGSPPPGAILFVSSAMALVVLVSGIFYFRRMEQTFADVV